MKSEACMNDSEIFHRMAILRVSFIMLAFLPANEKVTEIMGHPKREPTTLLIQFGNIAAPPNDNELRDAVARLINCRKEIMELDFDKKKKTLTFRVPYLGRPTVAKRAAFRAKMLANVSIFFETEADIG